VIASRNRAAQDSRCPLSAVSASGPLKAEHLPLSAQVPGTSLAALQAFDVAFRLESFKAAAKALHLTDSAISHRIRRLEARMGDRLFDRLHRRIHPTAAGEALAAFTGRAFRDLARALDGSHPTSRGGTLRLSVFPLFRSAWLLPRLADFISRHPNIELSITTTTRMTDLQAEAVDAVIRSGGGDWPGLTTMPLMRLQATPIVSPSLTSGGSAASVAALSELPLIQMSEFPQAWPNWFAGQGKPFTRPARTVWVEGFEAAMLAAERGAGIALGLSPLCDASIVAGRLFELPGKEAEPTTCWLAFRSDDHGHPPVAAFRRWLMAALGDTDLAAL
jgi:DNA-binding transcriptional LysR family regulator